MALMCPLFASAETLQISGKSATTVLRLLNEAKVLVYADSGAGSAFYDVTQEECSYYGGGASDDGVVSAVLECGGITVASGVAAKNLTDELTSAGILKYEDSGMQKDLFQLAVSECQYSDGSAGEGPQNAHLSCR